MLHTTQTSIAVVYVCTEHRVFNCFVSTGCEEPSETLQSAAGREAGTTARSEVSAD